MLIAKYWTRPNWRRGHRYVGERGGLRPVACIEASYSPRIGGRTTRNPPSLMSIVHRFVCTFSFK